MIGGEENAEEALRIFLLPPQGQASMGIGVKTVVADQIRTEVFASLSVDGRLSNLYVQHLFETEYKHEFLVCRIRFLRALGQGRWAWKIH